MGKFNFIATELPGVVVIEPTVFPDPRGYFMETYARRDFAQGGIDREFVPVSYTHLSVHEPGRSVFQ